MFPFIVIGSQQKKTASGGDAGARGLVKKQEEVVCLVVCGV